MQTEQLPEHVTFAIYLPRNANPDAKVITIFGFQAPATAYCVTLINIDCPYPYSLCLHYIALPQVFGGSYIQVLSQDSFGVTTGARSAYLFLERLNILRCKSTCNTLRVCADTVHVGGEKGQLNMILPN